ncbi:MAG: hypothetical protein RLZZ142_1609 [Verrucomicrobiota bacterium]
MKNERLSYLLHAHLDGMLSSEEQHELEQLLLHSAAARGQFWEETRIHHLLTLAEQQSPEILRPLAPLAAPSASDSPSESPLRALADPPEKRSGSYSFKTFWRNPFIAAAAGIVLSALGTSAVWAVATQRAAFKPHPLPLADEGFESGTPVPATGVPSRVGLWSGDFTRIVGAEKDIEPHSGKRMLRFLRADSERSAPGSVNYVSDVSQVIDLRPYRSEIAAGAQINLSAWFCSLPSPESMRFKFALKVATFRGALSEAPQLWDDAQHQSLSYSAKHADALRESGRWQRVETVIPVSPDADFIVVVASAFRDRPTPTPGTVEFPGHYMDDLSVFLSPAPPQRFP